MKTAILIIILTGTGPTGRTADIDHVGMASREVCEIAAKEITDKPTGTQAMELKAYCVNDA